MSTVTQKDSAWNELATGAKSKVQQRPEDITTNISLLGQRGSILGAQHGEWRMANGAPQLDMRNDWARLG